MRRARRWAETGRAARWHQRPPLAPVPGISHDTLGPTAQDLLPHPRPRALPQARPLLDRRQGVAGNQAGHLRVFCGLFRVGPRHQYRPWWSPHRNPAVWPGSRGGAHAACPPLGDNGSVGANSWPAPAAPVPGYPTTHWGQCGVPAAGRKRVDRRSSSTQRQRLPFWPFAAQRRANRVRSYSPTQTPCPASSPAILRSPAGRGWEPGRPSPGNLRPISGRPSPPVPAVVVPAPEPSSMAGRRGGAQRKAAWVLLYSRVGNHGGH
jgi:hypothetical protein